MASQQWIEFTSRIQIIGVNPYVLLPIKELRELFKQSGRVSGPIPIKGTINGSPFTQTLVKYSSKWRLYLNNPMRKDGACDVGDNAEFKIQFDPAPRIVKMPSQLEMALKKNKKASIVFNKLAPHYQKEIMRYINKLKNEEAIARNVQKAIGHLLGKERFVGRKPVNLKAI